MGLFNYLFKKNEVSPVETPSVNAIVSPVQNAIEPGFKKALLSETSGVTYREPEIFGVDLKQWQQAVENAWTTINPNRTDLADIYKAISSYDSQAMSCIMQRKLLAAQGDIAFFNQDGTVNEQATLLIKSPSGSTTKWFKNFMSYSLDSIFYGFELVTINVVNKEIIIKKVPERNVIPNQHLILKDAVYANTEGNTIDFSDGALDLITCKISYTGDLNDLGILNGIAPYFFSKALSSWKMHADKFGMLTRVFKTSDENKSKLLGSYKAMQNHMRANFLVLGQDDDVKFEGDTRTSITIYKELNDYCDSSIAKIILGQTGTTDEKSFSGSSTVHKDILDQIIKSDREFLESVVNDQLIPKLQIMGILPQNIYFGISETVNLDLKEHALVIKSLSDAGFKADPDYIEKTFGIPLQDESVKQVEPTKKTNE